MVHTELHVFPTCNAVVVPVTIEYTHGRVRVRTDMYPRNKEQELYRLFYPPHV